MQYVLFQNADLSEPLLGTACSSLNSRKRPPARKRPLKLRILSCHALRGGSNVIVVGRIPINLHLVLPSTLFYQAMMLQEEI